jgi:hypothetical protein
MLNKKRLVFYRISPLVFLLFIVFGCANQQRPMGGPKDLTPPVLLKASPPNMTRHFAAKEIVLDFDEFFKLNNQYQEIVMSPVQDKQPEYKIRKKSLVINFKDTLQKNTTYVINFGKAIQDVNESNTLKNFTYVFSTGSHIDSLSVSGRVINTLTQEKEKDITVMLFPIDKDSLYFGKKKPSIFATTDSSGNFSMNNLHDGNYRIYALKENTPDKIYNKDDELIAFLKKTIHLDKDTSGIQLNLFQEEPAKFRMVSKKFDLDGKMSFIFNKPLRNPTLRILYPPGLDAQKIVDFSKTKDTAYLYSKSMDFDSIRIAFSDNNKQLDTVSLLKGRKEEFVKGVSFSLNLAFSAKLKPTSDLIITSNLPINSFDPTLITLYEDSTAVNNINLTRDTANTRKFIIKYKWKEDSRYILSAEDGAFTNLFGDKSKKILKSFQIDKSANYSSLTLHVTIPDSAKAYVVQVYQDLKNILRSDPVTKNTALVYNNFLTGKYKIRVIYDENRNGKWDTGNVKQKRYPENIWINPVELTLRPNWDAEEKLDIPKEQVQP